MPERSWNSRREICVRTKGSIIMGMYDVNDFVLKRYPRSVGLLCPMVQQNERQESRGRGIQLASAMMQLGGQDDELKGLVRRRSGPVYLTTLKRSF